MVSPSELGIFKDVPPEAVVGAMAKKRQESKKDRAERRKWNIEHGGGTVNRRPEHPEHYLNLGLVKRSQRRANRPDQGKS